MLIRKGFVNKEKIWNFVKNMENDLVPEKWNGKENNSGRKCLWLGVGVNLGFNCSVFEGLYIKSGVRKKMNELWGGDEWNSILIYKYDKGVELKNHVDRDIFDKKVVLINISNDDLFGGNIRFFYDGKIEILSNAEILEFDNRKLHGVQKVTNERWSISIRKVLV